MKLAGFTKFLVASDSIASESRRETSPYQWGSETSSNIIGSRSIQDASITNAKIGTAAIGTANIGTVSFSQLYGGTANLGGTANGDGVLSVNGSAGNEVVRADNAGLTVKTQAGTTIIDGSGLTTANFVSNGTVSQFNTRTTSSTSFTDITNTTILGTLSKTSKVLFLCSGNFSNYIDTDEISSIYVALNVNGTLFPDATNGFGNVFFAGAGVGVSPTSTLPTWSGHYLANINQGTFTAKLQWSIPSSVPSGTLIDAQVSNTDVTYLILGA